MTKTQVSELYVSIFNRASEQDGNTYWAGLNKTAAEVADLMLATSDAQTYFGSSLDTNQAFVEHIYLNTLNKTAADDAEGIAYWVGLLDGGTTRGEMVSTMIDSIATYAPDGVNYDATDTATVAAYNQFSNRVEVSDYYADTVATAQADYATTTSFGADLVVTDDASTVTTAQTAADTVAADIAAELLVAAEFTNDTTVTALSEDVAIGTEVKTVATNEEGVTYTVDNANFAISAAGVITTAAALDYETLTAEVITVTATDTDGNTSTQELTLTVNDVAATYALAADAATAKDGDTVNFTFTADSEDNGATTEVSYTISGVDAADVVGGSLTGTATVVDGVATVAVTLMANVDNSANVVTASIDGMTLTAATTVTTETANDAVSIGLTEIAVANDAGEYITKDAGDTGSTSYTIASSDSASIDARVIIGGDANLNITAQGGDDTIIIDGTGNNVVNAGDTDAAGTNANTIILGNGNNVVIVGDGEWNSSTVTAGTGINTVEVSGTNTFALNDFTNIQNLIIEDGAIVILDEDLLATFDSVVVNGTTATLEIIAAAGTTTVDLTSVLTGSLASLELADNTAVELTTAQITNIAAFNTNTSGNIVADEDGTALVVARGGSATTEVGTVTLEAAMTQDLAETANLSYTMSLTAQELFDQLYLGDANVSTPGTDNDGTAADQILYGATATVTITDTATSAQAVAFDAAGVTFAAAYAVADTAANLAANVGTGTWLTEDNISSLTITTAATYTQADTIFSEAKYTTAIAAALADADLTLTAPSYTIADTSANVTANITDTDITGSDSVTLLDDATVAEATTITSGDITLVGGYNLEDTPSNLNTVSTAVRNGATDITTITTDSTAIQAGKIISYNNTGDTVIHNITDTALALYNTTATNLEVATVVEITGGGVTDREVTVTQLDKLDAYLAEGYTLEIKDTAANLTSATGLALIEAYNIANVLVTPTDALTIAQYNAIAAVATAADFGLLNGANAYEITDTAANIIDATDDQETDVLGNGAADTAVTTANIAILNGVTTAVTVSDTVTVADITTIDGTMTLTVGTDLLYSLEDTAALIEDEITGGDTYTTVATDVTLTTAATANDGVVIDGIGTIDFAIEDTLALIAAEVGDAALVNATSITSTDDTVTVALAWDVSTINTAITGATPAKSALTYAISDAVGSFPTASEAGGVTDADEVALLSGATSVHMTGTGADIKTYATDDTTGADLTALYAHVDTYDIVVANTGSEADHDADTTYYDGATTISITGTLTVANAETAYATIDTDARKAKVEFVDITDSTAQLLAASSDAAETILVGKTTTVTVNDAPTVAEATSINGVVNGTLVIDAQITDTVANLLTASNDIVSVATGMTTTGNPTVAQYQTLIDMMQTAEIIPADLTSDDLTELITGNISDTIANVQNASVEMLTTMGDTADNEISLQAGSEVSFTIAQAEAAVIASANPANIFKADGSTATTYEIVDTIDNLINAMTNSTTLSDELTHANTIIATAGTTVPTAYMVHLKTLVEDAAFDTENSVYSISSTNAAIVTNNGDATTYATAIEVTDAVSYTDAATTYAYNTTATTFTAGIDSADFTNFITITSDVAAYNGTTEEAIVAAAGMIVDLEDDSLTAAEAASIVTLLGANATVTYALSDTPAALAAADASVLANATAITASGTTTTIAEAAAITAGATHVDANGDLDATLTYSVTDTATNIAANTAVAVAAAATVQTALNMATMAEALTIETAFATVAANTKTIALDIADTATNVVANIAALVAINDAVADENFLITGANDNISLTTTVTAAQAAFLDATYTGEIDTAADVLNSNTAITDGYYLEDTAANLLAATAAYSEADAVVVTDAVNVSQALQIADLADANCDAAITQAQAIAKMTFNIDDGEEYIIAAFAEDNALLGAAASVSIDGTAITLHENRDSGDFHLVGSVTELNTLSTNMLAIDTYGYIIKDSLANYVDATTLNSSDNKVDHIIVDTATNIAAADLSVTGTAEEVQVTDTVDVTTLANLQALGLSISTVAGVSDTTTNLKAATLGGALQDVTTITVTDATITDADVDLIVVAGADADGANLVYNLSDAYDNMNTAAIITNAATVVVSDAILASEADTIYALNTTITMTIEDSATNTAGVLITGTNDSRIDAINAATVVTCTDADVTVAEANALIAVAGFDGVYTLSDTAANLSAADSSVLANSVEVQVTDNPTVAEATILTALANIDLDGNDLPNFTISDTAANLSAASATLLDDVAAVTIITDDEVTAAQATALQTLIDNTDVAGLTSADNFDVVDTLANITAAANADAVEASVNLTATDDLTLAQAITVIATNSDATDIIYDLVDTRGNLQGATSTQADYATDVTVTDDITAAQAGIINGVFDGAGTNAASFAKVTGTMAELTSAIVGQATTVDVTDAMTVAELATIDGSGFLATAGTKLVGGYDVEDGVDNIVNAALNNDFSAAVVGNATDVALTGSTTMNMAAASVIMGLNFSGAYDIADTATEVVAAAAATINGATTVTVEMEDGVQESFDATSYTSTVAISASGNAAITDGTTITLSSDVDVLTLTSGTIYDVSLVGGLTIAHDQYASDAFNAALGDGDFSVYSGYRTGDGFVVSNAVVEDSILVWSDDGTTENAVVLDATATLTIDNFLISGAANDTIDLATLTAVDTIIFAANSSANGADTITGFADGVDTLDFTAVTSTGTLAATDITNDSGIVLGATTVDGTNTTIYVIDTDATELGTATAAAITDFTSMSVVATFLNSDDGIVTSNVADEVHYFVINDGDVSGDAYIYEFVDGAGNTTIEADELTLVGTIDSDSVVAADDFTV